MNETQIRIMNNVKENWANMGVVYMDIIETDYIIYMLLSNGTAYAIHESGETEWVVLEYTHIQGGKSLVVRPCKDMYYSPEAQDFYCNIDGNCCIGLKDCRHSDTL